MSTIIRIKRRRTGNSGPPLSLKGSELAFNEVDNTLWIGKGADSNQIATEKIAIGGNGAFIALSGDQEVGGRKTFLESPYAPTPAPNNSSLRVANTAFVSEAISEMVESSDVNRISVGESPPSSPSVGDIWFDTN
jgi:hypothetical protein